MAIPVNPIDLSALQQLAGNRVSYLNLPTEVADISKYYEPMFEVAKAKQQIQGALEGQRMQNEGAMQNTQLSGALADRREGMKQQFEGEQNALQRAIEERKAMSQERYNEGMLGAKAKELDHKALFDSLSAAREDKQLGLDEFKAASSDQYTKGLLEIAQKGQVLDEKKTEKSYELELFKNLMSQKKDEREENIKMLGGMAAAYKSAKERYPDRAEEIKQTYLANAVENGYMTKEQAASLSQLPDHALDQRASGIIYTAGLASDYAKHSEGSAAKGMSQSAVDKQNERYIAAEKGAKLIEEKLLKYGNPHTPDTFQAGSKLSVAVGAAQSALGEQGEAAERRRLHEELQNDYDEIATYRAQSRNVPPTSRNIKSYKDEIPGPGQLLSKADFVPAFINEHKEFVSNLPEDHPERKNPIVHMSNGELLRKSDIEELVRARPDKYKTYEDAEKAVKSWPVDKPWK
jgi:hypothetical protein